MLGHWTCHFEGSDFLAVLLELLELLVFVVPWSNHHNNHQIIGFLVPSLTSQPNPKLLVKIEPLGEVFGPLLT